METLGYEKAEIKFGEKNLEALLKQVKKKILDDSACECNVKEEYPFLVFSGRISDDNLRVISGEICFKNIDIARKNGLLQIYPKNEEGGIDFQDLYQEAYKEYYQFRGSAIYSGVIPRLCRVDYKKPEMSNMDMQRMHSS